VQALVMSASTRELINNAPQMFSCSIRPAIVGETLFIFTFLHSQMPYPYVHLVSFVVHFYLIFGHPHGSCISAARRAGGSVRQSAVGQLLHVE
jgi:hypothetical protein